MPGPARTRIHREALAVPGPVDLHATAGFLFEPDGPDLRFSARGLVACVRAGRGPALIEIEPRPGGLDVTMRLAAGARVAVAIAAARQLAGLPREPGRADPHAAFLRVARADAVLAPLVSRGLRLPQRPDPAACILGAVMAQQVTVSFASELTRRVRARWGERVRLGGAEWTLPPPAERLASLGPDDMRPLQVSRRKAEYVRDLAREVADGTLDLPALAGQSWDEACASLVARRGVGPTTAAWLLSFGAGHPDAWPPADVGLWRALERIHGRRDGARVRAWVARYDGMRSLLAVNLWAAQRAGRLARR